MKQLQIKECIFRNIKCCEQKIAPLLAFGQQDRKSHPVMKTKVKEKRVEPLARIAALWESFQIHTTSHGIPHVGRARGLYKKIFWGLSTLCCMGALSYNAAILEARLFLCYEIIDVCRLNDSVQSYLEFNVRVSIIVKNEKVMIFPAVTICNNNPLKKSKSGALDTMIKNFQKQLKNSSCFSLDDYSIAYFSNWTTSTIPDGLTSSTAISESSYSTTQKQSNFKYATPFTNNSTSSTSATKSTTNMTFLKPSCFPSYDKMAEGQNMRSDFGFANQLLEKFIAMNSSDRMLRGHLFSNMVYDCSFQGVTCEESDFVYLFNTFHGNCYTFNSVRLTGSRNDLKVARKAGSRFGLAITFNLEQEEYIGDLAESAGLRVVIHDPSRMPFPEDEGILVSPSALTHIGVTKSEHQKLGGLYGECRSEADDDDTKTMYQKLYNLSYCEKGCIYTCLNEEIINTCACSDIKFPFEEDRIISPCSIGNSSSNQCTKSVWERYENGTLPCALRCSIPCQETIFKSTISSENWPSDNRKSDMLNNPYFNKLSSDLRTSNSSNYGKVVVFIQDFSQTTVSETPAYEAQQLSSDIGGVLGLYIGCSILSIVEFLELFLDVTFLGMYHTATNTCQCQKNDSRKKNQNRLSRSRYDRKVFPQSLKSNRKSEHSKKTLVEGLSIDDELEVTGKPRMGSYTGMSSSRRESKRMPIVF